ncbi:histidine phosphatase family protein [Nocardioides sp. R1-1]|uniref:histidine phosphatase family protein n=1 Tax=Nocardioides sp. R1-1 TaxID=3383502 RepID=UPI0038D1DC05
MRPRWQAGPSTLVLVRHGESLGNQAAAAARASGAEALELRERDADVPLSETGRHQARALGAWLAETGGSDTGGPTVAVASPYRRASDTARLALEGLEVPLEHDERLRERDLGVLDRLTGTGVRARHPQEAERRQHLGKFYYQPPSGESWADVALRVRSLLHDLAEYDGERVWLFTHQAVIMSFRLVLEGLDETRLLELDRQVRIPNASVTTYHRTGHHLGHHLELASFADAAAVDRSSAHVTREAPATARSADAH